MSGEPGRITPAFRPVQREKRAPCQSGCATGGDVRGWIGVVAQRKRNGLSNAEAYAAAWRMITDVNPFPASLGRICPHPCESHCNRSDLDGALNVNALERFLGDWAIASGLGLPRLDDAPRDEWIGVVGAGPSGLSFAYQMARRGYRVTIYERNEKAGGMLRYGIPDYRLPPDVLDAEIRRIEGLGVEIRLRTAIGRDVTLAELREMHTVVYLGIGAQLGRSLGLEGEGEAGGLVVARGRCAPLAQCDGILPRGTARPGPLVAIGDITPAGHLELDGPAAGRDDLAADIHLALPGIGMVRRAEGLGEVGGGLPDQQFAARTIAGRRIGELLQHRLRGEPDRQSHPA